MIIRLKKKIETSSDEKLYKKLVEEYGVPDSDRWGIKRFEFSDDGKGQPYQFVLEARTKKPIQRKFVECLGHQNGMYFYLTKGKKMSIMKEYSPSGW